MECVMNEKSSNSDYKNPKNTNQYLKKQNSAIESSLYTPQSYNKNIQKRQSQILNNNNSNSNNITPINKQRIQLKTQQSLNIHNNQQKDIQDQQTQQKGSNTSKNMDSNNQKNKNNNNTFSSFMTKENNVYHNLNNKNQTMQSIKKPSQVFRQDPHFSNYKHILQIGKGNNSELVKNIFKKKNWKVVNSTGKQDMNFHLKWIQSYNLLNYDNMHEGSQICNHIQNIDIFTSKNGLLELIKEFENDPIYMRINSSSFLPESYILTLNKTLYDKEENEFLEETKNEGCWIHKPWNLNCGGGIKMVANLYKFKKEFQTLKKDSEHIKNGQKFYSEYFSLNCIKSVIQKYIDKPLLINNKKFDIRCYILIACTNPLVVFYNQGYIRLSMQDYSMEGVEKEKNIYTHLTNAAIQKQHKDYQLKKEETIWDMIQFEEYCINQHSKTKQYMENIENTIKNFLTYVMHIGEQKLSKKYGCFELMGVDILIDENFRPYLIELNSNPALECDTKVKQQLIPGIVENSVNTVLEIHSDPLKRVQKLKNIEKTIQPQAGEFQLLINEQNQFSYINYYQEVEEKRRALFL